MSQRAEILLPQLVGFRHTRHRWPIRVTLALAIGEAAVTIQQTGQDGQNGNVVAAGLLQIAPVAPGLFTADASGRGVPTATVLRVKADGAQSYEPIATFDAVTNRYEPLPIDLGAASDQLFLIAFGTGLCAIAARSQR